MIDMGWVFSNGRSSMLMAMLVLARVSCGQFLEPRDDFLDWNGNFLEDGGGNDALLHDVGAFIGDENEAQTSTKRVVSAHPIYHHSFVLHTELGHCKSDFVTKAFIEAVSKGQKFNATSRCGEPGEDFWALRKLDGASAFSVMGCMDVVTIFVISLSFWPLWARSTTHGSLRVRSPVLVWAMVFFSLAIVVILGLPLASLFTTVRIPACTMQQGIFMIQYFFEPLIIFSQILRIRRYCNLQDLEGAKLQAGVQIHRKLHRVLRGVSSSSDELYSVVTTLQDLRPQSKAARQSKIVVPLIFMSLLCCIYTFLWCTAMSCRLTGFGLATISLLHHFIIGLFLLYHTLILRDKASAFGFVGEAGMFTFLFFSALCVKVIFLVMIEIRYHDSATSMGTYNFMLFRVYFIFQSTYSVVLSMLVVCAPISLPLLKRIEGASLDKMHGDEDFTKAPLSAVVSDLKLQKHFKNYIIEGCHSEAWILWCCIVMFGKIEEKQAESQPVVAVAQVIFDAFINRRSPLAVRTLQLKLGKSVQQRIDRDPQDIHMFFDEVRFSVYRMLRTAAMDQRMARDNAPSPHDMKMDMDAAEANLQLDQEALRSQCNSESDIEGAELDAKTSGDGKQAMVSVVWHLLVHVLGSRIVTVPFYIAVCGWSLGYSLLILFASMSLTSALLVSKLARIHGAPDYPSLARIAYGDVGFTIVNLAAWLLQMGSFIGRLLIVGSCVPPLVLSLLEHTLPVWDRRVTLVVTIMCITPFALKRDLAKLSFLAALSFMLTMCLVAVYVYIAAVAAPRLQDFDTKWPRYSNEEPSRGTFQALGGFLYMFTFQDACLPLTANLRDPTFKRYSYACSIAVAIIVAIFLTVTVCSEYLFSTYANRTSSNFLDNFFPEHDQIRLANICRAFIALSVLVSIPQAVFTPRRSLMSIFESKSIPNVPQASRRKAASMINEYGLHVTCTMICFVFALTVAVVCKNLGTVFNVIGGIAGTALTILLPVALWLRLADEQQWAYYKVTKVSLLLLTCLGLVCMSTTILEACIPSLHVDEQKLTSSPTAKPSSSPTASTPASAFENAIATAVSNSFLGTLGRLHGSVN